jgi:hypothetical protein
MHWSALVSPVVHVAHEASQHDEPRLMSGSVHEVQVLSVVTHVAHVPSHGRQVPVPTALR